jgi:hypothetical protein
VRTSFAFVFFSNRIHISANAVCSVAESSLSKTSAGVLFEKTRMDSTGNVALNIRRSVLVPRGARKAVFVSYHIAPQRLGAEFSASYCRAVDKGLMGGRRALFPQRFGIPPKES